MLSFTLSSKRKLDKLSCYDKLINYPSNLKSLKKIQEIFQARTLLDAIAKKEDKEILVAKDKEILDTKEEDTEGETITNTNLEEEEEDDRELDNRELDNSYAIDEYSTNFSSISYNLFIPLLDNNNKDFKLPIKESTPLPKSPIKESTLLPKALIKEG